MARTPLEKALIEVLNPIETAPNVDDLNVIAQGSYKTYTTSIISSDNIKLIMKYVWQRIKVKKHEWLKLYRVRVLA
jgi:hypothetical protein